MRDFNKIFGVGISRTGTSSLTAALELLGIPTIHWPTNMLDISKYRGSIDITVACRYKELDRIFPDSLFVYTVREQNSWLKSVTAHYRRINAWMNLPPGAKEFAQEADLRIYGSVRPSESDFIPAYHRHHAGVVEYFNGRENRLLQLDIIGGDSWSKLCRFLEISIPETPFPHLNKLPSPERAKRRGSR